MRKILCLISLAALMSSAALAGSNTANLSVSSSIAANCNISTTAVGFGAYVPLAAPAVVQTGSVSYTCVTGTTISSIYLDQGLNPAGGSSAAVPLRQMSDGSSHNLTYNLYTVATYTAGNIWGGAAGNFPNSGFTADASPHSLTIYGQIDAGQHSAPVAASYTDTVVATINF